MATIATKIIPIRLDSFTQGYIMAALFSSTDEFGEPLDGAYTVNDLAPGTLERMREDCRKFQAANEPYIREDLERAGIDFWFTRNGHGAGFWDGDWPQTGALLTDQAHAFGQTHLFVGDNGLIYAL